MKQLQQITIELRLKKMHEFMTDVMSVLQDTEKIEYINHVDFYNLKSILKKITLKMDRTQNIYFWGDIIEPLIVDNAEFLSLKKLYFRNQTSFTDEQRETIRAVVFMIDKEMNKHTYVLSC
jgi:hypothetical protein